MLTSSCTSIYVPNLRNSPLFTKAGEVQASAQVTQGLDLQSAVSITNHIGLMVNYAYWKHHHVTYPDYHYHRFLEGGIGYYQHQEQWRYEIYAGYGWGEGAGIKQYDFFGPDPVMSVGRFERYFIQPAWGLDKRSFQISFIPRLSAVNFKAFKKDATVVVMGNHPRLFFEPALSAKLTILQNLVTITSQVGYVTPLSSDIYYDYLPFQVSVGLGLRLDGSLH